MHLPTPHLTPVQRNKELHRMRPSELLMSDCLTYYYASLSWFPRLSNTFTSWSEIVLFLVVTGLPDISLLRSTNSKQYRDWLRWPTYRIQGGGVRAGTSAPYSTHHHQMDHQITMVVVLLMGECIHSSGFIYMSIIAFLLFW